MIYKHQTPGDYIPSGKANLIFKARMLWRDMATWLNLYMYSLYGGYANHDLIETKLYQLSLEYGNVMKLIFGDRVSEGYITSLSNYIIILGNLFHALLAGNENVASEQTKQLYQNIDQRAAYLAQINPYWDINTWRTLLYTFNKMILENSTSLLTKDFGQSILIFDRLLTQSSIIGDYFSEGIFNYLRET